jgi:hypothetical protein
MDVVPVSVDENFLPLHALGVAEDEIKCWAVNSSRRTGGIYDS